MTKGFSIQVKGLDRVLRDIAKIDSVVADNVDREIGVAAENVASDARMSAPKVKGRLRSSIHVDNSTRFRKRVIASEKYAPYVEFSTGKYVFSGYNFTPAQRAYARQFYVSGKGRTIGHPYLFPAYDREIPRLLGRIKKTMFQ
jgi:hypothetical protein